MKVLENKQMRGIVGGVAFGLFIAFVMQALDVALWMCLSVGILSGLEAGWFAASPRRALEAHRAAVRKVNFELRWPEINWDAFRPDWTWAEVRKFLGDAAATVVAITISVAYFSAAACYFVWFANIQPATWPTTISLLLIVIPVVLWYLYIATTGEIDFFTKKPISGLPWSHWYFKCSTYRQRILFRFALSPVLASVVVIIGVLWVAVSICLLPVYVLFAVFAQARKYENVAMTIGIVAGVIIGFIYGYTQNFALLDELTACGIGATSGLATGALAVLCGHEKVASWCMHGYSKVAVWHVMD